MSELALKLIAENRKSKASFLDLGWCGLTVVPEEVGELFWLESLSLSHLWHEWSEKAWQPRQTKNRGDSNDDLYNIAALSKLTGLRSLFLDSTMVTDLTPLIKLINLHVLYAPHTQVVDLTPLACLINLQSIYISHTPTVDISPLASLVNLKVLNVANTKICSLSSLVNLVNLEILDASHTQISDLAPLASLAHLKQIHVTHTLVADISPLKPMIKGGLPVKRRSDFSKGDGIYVEDCPLVRPPVEIINQGLKAILNYFVNVTRVISTTCTRRRC